MLRRTERVADLSGEWRLALDSSGGNTHDGFVIPRFLDTIYLPGTTTEQAKGEYNASVDVRRLSPEYVFQGFAWYQRDVEIDESWRGKHIELMLERTRISHIWVDDEYVGMQQSLCTSHRYILTQALIPGYHKLTIMVDNANLPVTSGHQMSADTQTNWNGILGRIELRAVDPVWIEDIQVYPNVGEGNARLDIVVQNESGADVCANLRISAASTNTDKTHVVADQICRMDAAVGTTKIQFIFHLTPAPLLWDDHAPAVYLLSVSLDTENGGSTYRDGVETTFGLRELEVKGTQLAMNHRTIFLRGKHDGCVFPLTGYAPMDEDEWKRIFHIAKSYGINHYRFHSWCPPEAAFAAADDVGMYLGPELPYWGQFSQLGDEEFNPATMQYLRDEGLRIMRDFGNHPSFVTFSLGNELHGSREAMSSFIAEYRDLDARHLYAEGANNFYWDPTLSNEADFWITMRTAQGEGAVRGSFSHSDKPLGHIQANRPSTEFDYSQSISSIPVPVIGHEVGQYQSYPNYDEIGKYTGVLKPRNLEEFMSRLDKSRMLDQASQFHLASGKLAVICYREELEAALRTPGFAGFQLLDLQDYPGQGTALVGILDSFMDSKGFVDPREWREYCADTVLLARYPKYIYRKDELFRTKIELAHYGPRDLCDVIVEWKLRDQKRNIAQGELRAEYVHQGKITMLGEIAVPLAKAFAPGKLSLELEVSGTEIVNHYSIWVYPTTLDDTPVEDMMICRHLDQEMHRRLLAGAKVLLIPELRDMSGPEGLFTPDFWCYPMFRLGCEERGLPPAPGTLGLLCKDDHPALRKFPTEFHSDWQWWSIVMNSKALILDALSERLRPIVQVIDNFDRNHKLGMIFETRVADGKVLVCTSDLLSIQELPEVRQLLHSLQSYMATDDFQPECVIEFTELMQIVHGT